MHESEQKIWITKILRYIPTHPKCRKASLLIIIEDLLWRIKSVLDEMKDQDGESYENQSNDRHFIL